MDVLLAGSTLMRRSATGRPPPVVGPDGGAGPPLVRVRLELHGEGSETGLIAALDDVDGVVDVGSEDLDDD